MRPIRARTKTLAAALWPVADETGLRAMRAVLLALAQAALATGALPFLIGDAVKIVLAALVLPAAWLLVGRAGR